MFDNTGNTFLYSQTIKIGFLGLFTGSWLFTENRSHLNGSAVSDIMAEEKNFCLCLRLIKYLPLNKTTIPFTLQLGLVASCSYPLLIET